MKSKDYVIRRMHPNELQIAINWAEEEGWNPGLHDAATFFKADPQGFFIGLLDGVPIATGSAVAYGDSYGFCGLYIVKKEFRGQGYGLELTKERLKYLDARLTGLDGVLDKVEKYKRLGYIEAHLNTRYVYKGEYRFESNASITLLKNVPFEQVEAFDRRYFPAPRQDFLKGWISQPNSFAFGHMDEQGHLDGYGVIRKCIKGFKIGPLFAETLATAEEIFKALIDSAGEGPVFLDCPEPNLQVKKLVDDYQMEPHFEVIRMYRNGSPDVNMQHVFGISTFELG